MILLDTNLLVRLSDRSDSKHVIAAKAILKLQGAGETLAIIPQDIYEFWVVATRPVANNGLGLSIPECLNEIAIFICGYALLPDQPNQFDEWEKLVVAHSCQGKPAHDARIVAAMNTHRVTQLLTFNGTDFARYGWLTVLDPAQV